MTITELCSKLTAIGLEHGDLPVFYREVDPYTGADSEEEPDVELAPEWAEKAAFSRKLTGKVFPKRVLIRY